MLELAVEERRDRREARCQQAASETLFVPGSASGSISREPARASQRQTDQ